MKLTSTDGYCYNLVNGYLRDATEGELSTRYGSATVAFLGWYTDEACTLDASASQKAAIAADTAVTLWVGGYDSDGEAANVQTRIRTSLTAPTVEAEGTSTNNSFGKLFGTTLGNRVSITATFNAGGTTATFSNSGTVYFAISGGNTLYTKAQLDTALGKTPAQAAELGSPITLDDDGDEVGDLSADLRKLQIFNANLG